MAGAEIQAAIPQNLRGGLASPAAELASPADGRRLAGLDQQAVPGIRAV
jgi:hypothetical protein